jgi:hypothetical protein
MELQDNLLSQAAGGYDKDLGSTLRAALIRWEKRRGIFGELQMKFGKKKNKNEKHSNNKVVSATKAGSLRSV